MHKEINVEKAEFLDAINCIDRFEADIKRLKAKKEKIDCRLNDAQEHLKNNQQYLAELKKKYKVKEVNL